MKKTLLFLLLIFSLSFSDENKQDTITIGAGPYVQSQPYKGVNNLVLASPVFFYDNSIFYARWTRFGLYFLGSKGDEISWGFSLTAQPRTNGYFSDDSEYMSGMKDKENSWEGGIAFSASYQDSFLELIYLHDLLDKYNSYIVSLEVGQKIKFNKITFYPSLSIIYQNKDFLNYYYGVSKDESLTSIYNEYSTDSDFKYEVQTYISYPITSSLSAFLNAKINLLSQEAKNSPLTDKNYYYSGLVSLIYTFEF